METTNQIGLDVQKSEELVTLLSDLLANYSVFYQNARGYHWNIKGPQFFELHIKFEELYNDLFVKIDEVAERMLTLGKAPAHQFSDYLKQSEIKESAHVLDGNTAVEEVLNSLKTLLIKQRSILSLAGDVEDEGTTALMSDYIREQEKIIWMYSAYLA